MDDIEQSIVAAWNRIAPMLVADRDELAHRLARRRRAVLLRPPRAWCLAIRAADTRINPTTACIVPEDAAYPRSHLTGDALRTHRYAPHEVTLDTRLLKHLCEPVTIEPPGEQWDVIAQKLGVHPVSLNTARINGVLRSHYVRNLGGRRGRIPVLYTDQPLDPCSRTFLPADPLWGWTAHYLAYRLPTDFEQTIERVPAYRAIVSDRAYSDHPEAAEPPDPPDWDGNDCCTDHMEEQMLPTTALGWKFTVNRSPVRSTDPGYVEPDLYRILGTVDGTVVTIRKSSTSGAKTLSIQVDVDGNPRQEGSYPDTMTLPLFGGRVGALQFPWQWVRRRLQDQFGGELRLFYGPSAADASAMLRWRLSCPV